MLVLQMEPLLELLLGLLLQLLQGSLISRALPYRAKPGLFKTQLLS